MRKDVKQPAFQFYPGDWLKDPNLSKCSPATRGIWMDTLCAMHESDRSGVLTGTPDQLARVLRCTPSEVTSAAEELQSTSTATVRFSNGLITLTNRRMAREHKERQSLKGRQLRYRSRQRNGVCNAESDADVTSYSSSSSSSSSSDPNTGMAGGPSPPAPHVGKKSLPPNFAQFWREYPKKGRERSSRIDALSAWRKGNLEIRAEEIMAGLRRWIGSALWAKDGGEFILGAHRWLRREKWIEHPEPAAEKVEIGPGGVPQRSESEVREVADALFATDPTWQCVKPAKKAPVDEMEPIP